MVRVGIHLEAEMQRTCGEKKKELNSIPKDWVSLTGWMLHNFLRQFEEKQMRGIRSVTGNGKFEMPIRQSSVSS